MKAVLLLMMLVSIGFSTPITIELDSLPVDLQAKYRVEQAAATAERIEGSTESIVSNAESIGASVGTAISSGLSAISGEVNEFADTKVGMFTAVIIGWKVLGDDVSQLTGGVIFTLFSVPLFLIFLGMMIWSYKRTCIGIKYKTEEVLNEAGKITSKKFDFIDRQKDQYYEEFVFGHAIVLCLGIIIYFIFLWNAVF